MEQAILVDWSLFRTNERTQDFIQARAGQARMVLLVSDPRQDDYTHDSPLFDLGRQFPVPDIEWDAVIRNTGVLDYVTFKTRALSVLREASSLLPVIGLDLNDEVNKMYRENGVLITVEDL